MAHSPYPRPAFSGDFVAAELIAGSGRSVDLAGMTITLLESGVIPGGLHRNQVYEVVWMGDTVVTAVSDVFFRITVNYGNNGFQNTAEMSLFKMMAGTTLPWPYLNGIFVCPNDFDSVQFIVEAASNSGNVAYGSAPGGLLFGCRPIGDTTNVSIIS